MKRKTAEKAGAFQAVFIETVPHNCVRDDFWRLCGAAFQSDHDTGGGLSQSSGGGVETSGSEETGEVGSCVGGGGGSMVGSSVGGGVSMGSEETGGVGSSEGVGVGVGVILGVMLGVGDTVGEGDTEGVGEGDVEGEGDVFFPEIWSEPPLQVPGTLSLWYQPVAVSRQWVPAIFPLSRQKVRVTTLSLSTQLLPDQS